MKLIDIVLILTLGVILFFAVRRTIKTRKTGGCSCGCGGSCSSCAGCGACEKGK